MIINCIGGIGNDKEICRSSLLQLNSSSVPWSVPSAQRKKNAKENFRIQSKDSQKKINLSSLEQRI